MRKQFLLYIGIIIISVYFYYPIYILFLVSFSPIQFTIKMLYPLQYPVSITFSNLIVAIHSFELINPMIKSLKTAFSVAALSIIIGIPTAYGISRLPQKISYLVITIIFIVDMMPSIVTAIPISSEFISLGLYDTFIGLALMQELIVLPLVTFILVGAFQSIPREIEYQARIDGLGMVRTLYGVLVPLSKPAIIASFLLSWMFSWDEFTYAIILSPIRPTLPIIIYDNITRGNLLASTSFALIVSLPVLILTIILQKYLKGDYLAGGLKG